MKLRFDAKVLRFGGCWLWTANKNNNGYGQLWFRRKLHLAHRLSWLIHFGPIPPGVCVLHRCDTPACVNPGHLFLGTQNDNVVDCLEKGRARRAVGEKHPSAKLSEAQVLSIRRACSEGVPFAELARQYSVHPTTIADIHSRKKWKHLAESQVKTGEGIAK